MRIFAHKTKGTLQTRSTSSTIPGRALFGQSCEVSEILHLQRTNGNQALSQLLQSGTEERNDVLNGKALPHFGRDSASIPEIPSKVATLQTKLATNKPGDEYEQEADQVAEQVVRMPEVKLQQACVGGLCAERRKAEPPAVQRKTAAGMGAPSVSSRNSVVPSAGHPLDGGTRSFFEQRFGYDFGEVRVHTGPYASGLANTLRARAYTVGQDVVFGAGQYAPFSRAGRRLLAHELTHVVQQREGHTVRCIQRQDTPDTRSGGGPVPAQEAVVVLGSWDRTLTLPGGSTIRLPTEGSQALLRGEAIAVFPGHEPTEVMGLPGAFGSGAGGGAFPAITEEGQREREQDRSGPPGWCGLPSGVAVQEALEGGTTSRGMRVTAIFINVDEVDLEDSRQTSSEYRQIVAALASGRNTQVDIVIRHGSGISRVRRGSQTVEGAPLPADLRRYLPPTFRTLGSGVGTGEGGDDVPSTAPRRQRAARTARAPDSAQEPEGSTPRLGARGRVRGADVAVIGAAAAANAAMDIAEIYLQEWIQEKFYDPQNRAAFNQDLAREQPRIDSMVARHRTDAQRIRAHGGVPYAVVTLHVVYRTFGMPDGLSHSSFQDLWVTDANVESAPREGVGNPYRSRNIFDPEVWGSNFRDEQHSLVTYSYEIAETSRFARVSTTELAERLYQMHQYILQIAPNEGEMPEEVLAVVREMRDTLDRSIDLDDELAVAELREELLVATGGVEGIALQILSLVRMLPSNR